jgi:hypothetical protein
MNRARTAAAALAAAGIVSATAACSGGAQQPPSPTATASDTAGTTAATLPATPPGAQASEPGVLTLNYLATTRTGQSYVVSALAANPSAPIPAAAAAQLIGAIKAAFTLAAG